MKKISPSDLTRCAMIAALYTVISVALLPLAFGVVQARVSEALTLLPAITPLGIAGVTLGCLITNTYGVASGANILGAADIVLGTVATFVAAVMTRGLRKHRIKGLPVLASVPPVLINAVVIGAELTYAEFNTLSSPMLWVNMLQVGLGQLISCTALGLMLVWALERGGLEKKLFDKDKT